MKVVNTGSNYQIYNDDLKTYSRLPAQTYKIEFSKMAGFSLNQVSDIKITDSKIYGVHAEKVKKILNSFDSVNRNLGVILSGDKGIGKSLFAKLLSKEGMNRNIPVIIVDNYIPGIVNFIESIEQEAILLFDEFDKTFTDTSVDEGPTPQTHMLSLFDGVSSGKKLFVITCNNHRKLNEYLINRPGRFHYHIRFKYPDADEIREYLKDNLAKEYWYNIEDVVMFSSKVDLNYDCLRAIVFELNTGISFKDAIQDLNIVVDGGTDYNIFVYFSNGVVGNSRNVELDLFNFDDVQTIQEYVYSSKNRAYLGQISFATHNVNFDKQSCCYIIDPDNVVIDFADETDYYDSHFMQKVISDLKEAKIDKVEIRKVKKKDIHYSI